MIMEQAVAAHVDEAAAGMDEAAAEVGVADAEQEPPEQSHHQPCKLELFHHQQAEERQQAAVYINPTGASGTTTGTIATAVVMTYPTGTHLHHAQKRTGRVGIK